MLAISLKTRNMTDNQSTPRKGKPQFTLSFLLLSVTFCVCIIVANLIEIKTIDVAGITLTAGMIIFPLSYIINDCLVEVYGFRKARIVIWLGFAMNLFVTLALQLAIILPGSADWTSQEAMEAVYGGVPRILFASFVAFVTGSLANAWVMSRMKLASGGKRFSLRAIVSTIVGEGLDSLIFFPIAFGGILPWSVVIGLIVAQTLLKTVYEILVLPVTIYTVRRLKRLESLDTFDTGLRFTLFK